MVKEGISMETPTIMGSIEISRTRPYSSKLGLGTRLGVGGEGRMGRKGGGGWGGGEEVKGGG